MRSTLLLLGCRGAVATAVRRAVTLARGVAFWTAVFLPAVYIPLALGDASPVADPHVFGASVAVHVAALVAGNDYGDATGE
jgi:hypothetical protein